jgi:hypothetical protein
MKAIAMKATQQGWDSVKDLVENIIPIDDFDSYPYLVTNSDSILGRVTNVEEIIKSNFERTVHEKFDRSIFLDALDIVEEKIFYRGELQYRNPSTDNEWRDAVFSEYRLKPINPEVKQLQELADKLGYKIDKL